MFVVISNVSGGTSAAPPAVVTVNRKPSVRGVATRPGTVWK